MESQPLSGNAKSSQTLPTPALPSPASSSPLSSVSNSGVRHWIGAGTDCSTYIADFRVAADHRSNLIRLLAIAGFYSVHLLHYVAAGNTNWLLGFLQFSGGPPISPKLHAALTSIAVIWVAWALLIQRSLAERKSPVWLARLTVCLDVFLLTSTLVLTVGAQSPLVNGYLLIIMLVASRLDLTMIRWATVCCFVGFLFVLGCSRWPMGILHDHPLPIIARHYQLMLGLTILLVGITVGQWVRQVNSMIVGVNEGAGKGQCNG